MDSKSSNPPLRIGIDPGTNTGIAVYCRSENRFYVLDTVKIHRAFEEVLYWHERHHITVRVENAKTWKPFKGISRKESNEKIAGAGSIKRDCSIWEDFLTDHKIQFELTKLQGVGIKKIDAVTFRKYTGITVTSSSHARDAAMLVYDPPVRPRKNEEQPSQYDQPFRAAVRRSHIKG